MCWDGSVVGWTMFEITFHTVRPLHYISDKTPSDNINRSMYPFIFYLKFLKLKFITKGFDIFCL